MRMLNADVSLAYGAGGALTEVERIWACWGL